MIGDVGGFVLPLFKMAPYRWLHGERPIKDLDEYFPSVVKQAADQLERRGLVKIADKGRTQILKYKLEEMKPKVGKWDGKWRLVFFDVAEPDKRKRDLLRMYLMKLGMKRMQESVFVSPFDVADEIKYLREVLEIPHGVKMGVLEWIENADKLKEIFDL